MAQERDWQSLESKLSRGLLLEQAVLETGIPLEEAKKWLEERRKNGEFDDSTLRIVAAEALYHGLEKLIKLANADKRISSESFGESGSTSFESVDLQAARTLVKTALDLTKILKSNKKADNEKPSVAPDLFDISRWHFKED